MNRYVFLFQFFLSILFPPILYSVPNAFGEAVLDRAMQATIAIFPAGVDDPAGGGSGVLISPNGYALTNFHVVQPCGPAMKCGMANGNLYDAVVVGLDPVGDIALIRLLGPNIVSEKDASQDTSRSFVPFPEPDAPFPYAELVDSDAVRIGDTAWVMGNPFLLAVDYKPCVSRGIISGVHRYQFPAGTFLEYTDCLQTDAAVNPGNSGGPLFNDQGEVVGIVGRCSFEKRGRVNVGIGYAVSSNQVRYFLGDLKSGRIVDHATMNAVVFTDKEGRVRFGDVLGTSDAYRSGLRYDDQLLRFAGRTIDTANTFKNLIGIFPKNWRLSVTTRGKDGQRHDMPIRLGGLHGEAELIDMTQQMIEPPIAPQEGEKLQGDKLQGKRVQKEHYVPDRVKPFYQQERGYANFYFNRIQRDRVLGEWRNRLGIATNSIWEISGQIQGRPESYSFQIDDKGVSYQLPIGSGFWDAGLMKKEGIFVPDPLMHYQSPRGSGGLFVALYLMRRLALADAWDDAQVVYVGTAPVSGDLTRLHDVCSVSWLGNEARFYFASDDPENKAGELVLIEMFGSGLDFPCEIYFRRHVAKGAIPFHGNDIMSSETGNYGTLSIFEKDRKPRFDSVRSLRPVEINAQQKQVPVGDLERLFHTLEVRYGKILFGIFGVSVAVPAPAMLTTHENKPMSVPPREGAVVGTTSPVIAEALRCVVKIYGAQAGSVGGAGLHGYQGGIIVSPDGDILTTMTATLQADPITVVLDSGRKYEARLVHADPIMEIALLRIPALDLPFFDLSAPAEYESSSVESDASGPLPPAYSLPPPASLHFESVQIGDPVYAVSNPFNIAQGNEPASVQKGCIAARTTLRARRGVFETPYQGPIFVVDFTTNNPGACGGALISVESGRLIGILGKELRNRENNAWLNFAIPVAVFRDRVQEMFRELADRAGKGDYRPLLVAPDTIRAEQEPIPEDSIRIFQAWGFLPVSSVSRRTPPFIETVRPDSEAARLGLRPDDLIVMVNNRLTPSLVAVEYQILHAPQDAPITLTIERDRGLHDIIFLRRESGNSL